MMKCDSASFDQSLGVDVADMVKLRYQTLLEKILDLQKEYVSRKRRLHAVKRKRHTVLTEIFSIKGKRIRRKTKLNLRSSAQSFGTKSAALKGKRNGTGSVVAPVKSNSFLLEEMDRAKKKSVFLAEAGE